LKFDKLNGFFLQFLFKFIEMSDQVVKRTSLKQEDIKTKKYNRNVIKNRGIINMTLVIDILRWSVNLSIP